MTILPRAMTTGEKALIRKDNQSSRLYLTIHKPATIYSARLAAVPTSTDKVSSITYNSGSGTHTNILAEMTMYVGTSAGAYDLGMARIRKTAGIGATSGTFNIGLLSHIDWQSNCYLTIVDEFGLWPRWPTLGSDGTVAYMDTDIAYTDQHKNCLSFPIFPRIAVRWLTGATVTVVRDGSQSWSLNNTIDTYAWTAPGSSAISGDTTNTVTITYNAKSATAGYRVGLTVHNDDNVSFTGYGRVFVLQDESDAITQFRITSLEGSFSSGGWEAKVTLYDQADRSTIRDRALVVIHRRDFYGLTSADEGSIGYVAGDENIEMVGWIDGETIDWKSDDQYSDVAFSIKGPHFWLDQITMPTVGLKNITHDPTNWKRFQGLTAKSATWHLLMWRTTAPVMMDCFSIESGVAGLQLQSAGAQTVWTQLKSILNDFLLAEPTCDEYGRLFMQIEQQCLSAADRSGIPTILTLAKTDWATAIPFEREETEQIAGVDLVGEVYNGTNTSTMLYSLAPGRVFNYRGNGVFSRSGIVVLNQASLNALAGAIYGWKTNPYPRWPIKLSSNFHFCDIAPYQYLAIDIAAGDTPRGISFTGLRLIPRTIRRLFDDFGVARTEIIAEAESSIKLSVTGDTPSTPPEIMIEPPPPPPPPPDPKPKPSGNAREAWVFTTTAIYWAGDFFGGGQPTWNKVAGSLPAASPAIGMVTASGSTLYLIYSYPTDKIYKCTNPKDVSPTWTEVFAGQTYAGYPLSLDAANWGAVLEGSTEVLGVFAKTPQFTESVFGGYHFGQYNGSAWSWSGLNFEGSLAYSIPATKNWHTICRPQFGTWYNVPAGTTLNSTAYPAVANCGSGKRFNDGVWTHDGGDTVGIVGSGSYGQIYSPTSNTYGTVLSSVTQFNYAIDFYVYGSLQGTRTFALNSGNGDIWVGYGLTVALKATWPNVSFIFDALNIGGGSIVAVLSGCPQSNEFIRISNDGGDNWTAMTGNFWSLTSGAQVFIGAGLVY